MGLMKTLGIIFSGPMVRAILDSKKIQTRRVMKPQPDLTYRLIGDRIEIYHTKQEARDVKGNQVGKWRCIATHSSFTERRLHGGIGWEYLFTDKIQRLWAQGIRGLVFITRAPNKERIFNGFIVPQQPESNTLCTSTGMHSLPRNVQSPNSPNAAPGRRSRQQHTRESNMGHTIRKLAGQKSPRERDGGRETPRCEIDRRGAHPFEMGNKERALQSETCCTDSQDEPSFDIRDLPYQTGMKLWVRETWAVSKRLDSLPPRELFWLQDNEDFPQSIIYYRADSSNGINPLRGKWRPSIFMPRWASRITLEITGVRVERIQDISDTDCCFEMGCPAKWDGPGPEPYKRNLRGSFTYLWDSLNAKRSFGWDVNPWVWVIEFRRLGKDIK